MRRSARNPLYALLLCLGLQQCALAEDLLEVHAQARAADPLLAAAAAQRGVQQEAAVQARAALLPQWQIAAGAQRAEGQGRLGHELTSSLSQVLFDLARLRHHDAERSLLEAHDQTLRAAEQALAARVARAYFGVLSAQAALATAEVNEQTLATQAKQTASRFAAGLAAQVDVEQARTYHALARGGTVQARQALSDAREAMAQLTGRTPGTLKPLGSALAAAPPEPADAQAWVGRTLQSNPTLRALQRGVEAAGQRIDAARAGHLPTLSAAFDTTRSGGARGVDGPRNQLALRVALPLFAGGAVGSQVRQAHFQREAQREELEAARRALVRETLAQYQAVLAGVALIESSTAAMAAADRALSATRSGHALGTRSMTDLLLAIQNQAAARNAHDQARHGWVLATLLLQQATGSLGTAELAAVNRLLEDLR